MPAPGDSNSVESASRKGWRRWALRLLLLLLGLEFAWLVTVNLALSLPATQAWLNTLRPERFQLSWEQARSWYPGHLAAGGVVVSGQTPRQQWQAEADRVRGRVALLPLVLRSVRVSGGVVENGRYRQRPRPEPGQDLGEAQAWFPEIRGYEPSERGERLPGRRPVWTVSVEGARLEGRHRVWIRRVQAEFAGSALADLETRSQGGPLELEVRSLDLELERAWADADEEILSAGEISGTYRLGPYRYREHRGLRSLRFTDADLELSFESDSLEFVRLFLLKYPTLEADGQGVVRGRLALRAGRVADGTDLMVDARNLEVRHDPFTWTATGT